LISDLIPNCNLIKAEDYLQVLKNIVLLARDKTQSKYKLGNIKQT